jgi:hypothetical protein
MLHAKMERMQASPVSNRIVASAAGDRKKRKKKAV